MRSKSRMKYRKSVGGLINLGEFSVGDCVIYSLARKDYKGVVTKVSRGTCTVDFGNATSLDFNNHLVNNIIPSLGGTLPIISKLDLRKVELGE